MTLAELKAIEARANAATPGPWEKSVDDHGNGITEVGIWAPGSGGIGEYIAEIVTSERPAPDADFIAHAREDVPALVGEVKRSSDRAEQLHARVIELTALLNDSARLADHMARLQEYDAIAGGAS